MRCAGARRAVVRASTSAADRARRADHARNGEASRLGNIPRPSFRLRPHDATSAPLKDFLGSYPAACWCPRQPRRREALLEVLDAAALHPQVVPDFRAFAAGDARFAISVAALADGFALDGGIAGALPLAVLTERQLFPERAAQPRRRKRVGREPEAIIRDLGELSDGSPIVHEDHGVGRYRGLVTLEAGGMPAEYLEIEYAKGDACTFRSRSCT